MACGSAVFGFRKNKAGCSAGVVVARSEVVAG